MGRFGMGGGGGHRLPLPPVAFPRAELEGGVGGGSRLGEGGYAIDIATTNNQNPWVGKTLGQKHSTAVGLRLGCNETCCSLLCKIVGLQLLAREAVLIPEKLDG